MALALAGPSVAQLGMPVEASPSTVGGALHQLKRVPGNNEVLVGRQHPSGDF